jgi:uncharacterized membrane protein YdjX (TVP38/TMEM64 family)
VAARQWDRLLRIVGLVGLAGIVFSHTTPAAADLTALFSVSVFFNGPFSMFFPTALEPNVMTYARIHPVLLVAGVVTLGAILAEYVSYRIYEAALQVPAIERAADSRLARAVTRQFRTMPFTTVWVCALTPIPFWIARISAVLAGYSLPRFLLGVAVGRFPRFLAYALLGTVLPISTGLLLWGGLALAVVPIPILWWRHRRERRAGSQRL